MKPFKGFFPMNRTASVRVRNALTLCFLMLCLSLFALLMSARAQNPGPSERPRFSVLWTTLKGSVNPATANHLAAAIREAEKSSSVALVLELDTPGGLLSSVREMAQSMQQSMQQSKVPVLMVVAPAGASATSAGALLMLAAQATGMSAGTNIGAAHPVGPQGDSIKGDLGDKAVNDTAAMARSFAGKNGRDVGTAEKMVRSSLSLTAEEAVRARVVDYLVVGKEDLFRKAAADGKIPGVSAHSMSDEAFAQGEWVEFEWSFARKLLHWLADPNIASMLLALGVFLIYVELSSPGISFPGVLGGICILVAFIAFQMLPIRVGAGALLAFGLILILAEPFVTSHGILVTGGVASLVLGLIWIVNPGESQSAVSPWIWGPIGLFLGSVSFLTAVMAARLKKQSGDELARMGGHGLGGLQGYAGRVESIDEAGVRGKALFRGEVWSIESDVRLSVGDVVEPVEVQGLKLKVVKR